MMKIKITLLLLIAIQFCSLAQNSELLAKSYFLKAKEYYGNGDNTEALTNLNLCIEQLNGQSNPKTEALYVLIHIAKNDFLEAEKHITLYFDKATEDHSDYMKMVSLFAEITESAKSVKNKDILELFNTNSNISLVGKKENNKWGFVNREGTFIIQPQYDWVGNMEYERAIVKKDSKYGVINNQNKPVIPTIQDTIIRNSKNFIYLNANRYYFTNQSGESRLADGCFAFTNLADHFYLCHTDIDDRKGGLLLHINKNIVIKNIMSCKIYKSFDDKHHYLLKFKDNSMYSLIDENGNVEIETTKKFIHSPKAQMFKDMRDIKKIVETNIFIIEALDDSYGEPVKIYNAKTKQSLTYYYTEKEAARKEIINTKKGSFIRYYKIYENGKIGLVSDESVIKPQFNDISHAYGSYVFVTGNYGKGIVDNAGNVILPLKYSDIKNNLDSNKDVIKWYGVKQGKNVDVYDVKGKFLYESTLN